LILYKRFNTDDYSNHIPYAALGTGPNMYASYWDDNVVSTVVIGGSMAKLEGNNSPTYSSNAVIETVQIVGNAPESWKEWIGFVVVAKPIGSNTSLIIDARVDDGTNYLAWTAFTLDNTNDQLHEGGVSNTYWKREWSSLVGRVLQVRIRFNSDGDTPGPILMGMGILSHDMGLFG
jgi:hypothetical protein